MGYQSKLISLAKLIVCNICPIFSLLKPVIKNPFTKIWGYFFITSPAFLKMLTVPGLRMVFKISGLPVSISFLRTPAPLKSLTAQKVQAARQPLFDKIVAVLVTPSNKKEYAPIFPNESYFSISK